MSKVIPKEQLTAYQRWELGSVEEAGAASVSPHSNPTAAGKDESLRVALPTAEQLEQLHQEAWQEGYNLGLEEGRKAGYAAGAGEVERHAQQLKALAEALDAGLLRQDETVAEEVLSLSLAVANQLVRAALRVKPELILAAIREAMAALPSMDSHHRILVAPEHAEMVRDWLAREHGHLTWKVVEDAQLDPGGFRFESAHSELDGSLETRWREIVECLGADPRWLD